MLQRARQVLRASDHRFRYGIIDAQFIPFPDESFDAVIANQMLYHVPDRERALSEIGRVLRPGGQLYAATVGHDHLRELREMMAKVGVDASAIDAASEFGLENGEAQLSPYFERVTLSWCEDALIVPETEPLVAYALSTNCAKALRQHLGEFVKLVEGELAAKGAIHLRKDSGLYLAEKA
jgi:SAM-dependent methyltransferase